jgi:hypothetical protein
MLGKSAAFLFLWTALLSLGTFCFMQPVREKTFPAWGYNMYLRNASHVLHIHHAFHMLALAAVVTLIVMVSRGHFTSPVLVLLGTLIGGSLSDILYDDIREWKWAISPSAALPSLITYASHYESAAQVEDPLPSLITPLPDQHTDTPQAQQQEQPLQN